MREAEEMYKWLYSEGLIFHLGRENPEIRQHCKAKKNVHKYKKKLKYQTSSSEIETSSSEKETPPPKKFLLMLKA